MNHILDSRQSTIQVASIDQDQNHDGFGYSDIDLEGCCHVFESTIAVYRTIVQIRIIEYEVNKKESWLLGFLVG